MAKYNYWHIITKVSKEYKKRNPELQVGLIITHSYKKDDEGVCIMNWKTGKTFEGAYVLKYLGRILKTASKKEIFEKCGRWIKEKGYEKYEKKLGGKK
ncbi:hypothetical protein ES703_31233 [subsurface metagenome]